jgi:hypothetical protein
MQDEQWAVFELLVLLIYTYVELSLEVRQESKATLLSATIHH